MDFIFEAVIVAQVLFIGGKGQNNDAWVLFYIGSSNKTCKLTHVSVLI